VRGRGLVEGDSEDPGIGIQALAAVPCPVPRRAFKLSHAKYAGRLCSRITPKFRHSRREDKSDTSIRSMAFGERETAKSWWQASSTPRFARSRRGVSSNRRGGPEKCRDAEGGSRAHREQLDVEKE
jgi:hypothetical protein